MPPETIDRRKLAACLELLGSDKDGERQAAGLAAHRLVKSAGLQWSDVLLRPPPSPPPPPPPPAGWRDKVALCRSHPELLSEWEAAFLASIARRRGHPSPKQFAVLIAIADRVRAS